MMTDNQPSFNLSTATELRATIDRLSSDLKQVASDLSALNRKSKATGLSETESEKSDSLARLYEEYSLLRLRAIRLLRERGHDVQSYIEVA